MLDNKLPYINFYFQIPLYVVSELDVVSCWSSKEDPLFIQHLQGMRKVHCAALPHETESYHYRRAYARKLQKLCVVLKPLFISNNR